MGRRPNPLILEFFERGAKLNDNSNRYHHRCKACGEDFPKGRIDSLTNHLTKKCPAISEADRINACLALHGISHASGRPKYDGLLHSGPNMGPNMGPGMGPGMGPNAAHDMARGNTGLSLDHNAAQAQSQIWTPLETLAEVSRQIEANEKQDDYGPASTHDPTTEAVQTTLAAAIPNITAAGANPFELQEQFTLDNPPLSYSSQPQQEKKDATPQKPSEAEFIHHELSTEEQRLQQLLQPPASPSQTALSVAAAAATARLTSSLLDPQLLSDAAIAEQIAQVAPSADMMIDYPEPEREEHSPQATQVAQVTPPPSSARTAESSTPWGGMTYMAEDIHGPAIVTDHAHQLGPNLKGGYRMDTTTSPGGSRQKHCRAKFDKDRRIEVQEVRRIGACIRCRILRKVCSKGTPCDTCKKVLSPRVWRTGCVRTKLSEFIDLYSAGVQVVMAQKRINGYKTTYQLENTGVVVEASHFPESGHTVTFQVFQGHPHESDGNDMNLESHGPVILLDNNKEDIPSKVEAYMRNMLPEYITHEPSPHVRVTLEIADQIAKDTNDELLKRSLELWGIVEMMDRERQWVMLAKSPEPEVEDHWIKDDTESEAYSNICMQLTAAAERKASLASRNLLNGIQRSLQDGKTRLGFPMFLTVMLFLNCLEKTTWAFKAWDQENLRPKWPLERPPQSYTNQGHGLTELLRMLLLIRHVLPKTLQSDPDAPITTEGEGPEVEKYFRDLNVTPRYLRMRYHENNFQPTDSRSLEFLFCAQLLLHAPPAHTVLHPISQDCLHEVPQEVPHKMPQVVSQDMSEPNSQEISQDA
ncbi:putative zn 2cys6 transcription factor protein [Rosellinia necatrix]|uniref:Putative zn 2cys6 transcription factor protein n=1 Tax=Rosellinia necatrix TaxID=77044 RepID=A0A1W2TTM9_ROSNE|nr:putative zn 2cys6 transcription factor protein [Rosellinia necatrix]